MTDLPPDLRDASDDRWLHVATEHGTHYYVDAGSSLRNTSPERIEEKREHLRARRDGYEERDYIEREWSPVTEIERSVPETAAEPGARMVDARAVVREARRVAREQGWCDAGLHESLDRLGIADLNTPPKVRVRLAVEVDVTGAADHDDAVAQARAMINDSGNGMTRSVHHVTTHWYGDVHD